MTIAHAPVTTTLINPPAHALRYGSMRLWNQWVTPDMARQYLLLNTTNRRLSAPYIAGYAADMAAGNWEKKPVAICFDEEGRLGNGQHTLHAIIESGKPQELLMACDVSKRAIAMMDIGKKRTIEDIAHFIGDDLSSPIAAVVRMMLARDIRSKRESPVHSFSVLLAAYNFYRESIDFAFTTGSSTRNVVGVNAITRAVAAMAWYSHDRERIAEFLWCLRTGDANGKDDSAAIRLKELFMRANNGTWATRKDQFQKAKSALLLFLRREPATRLYGTEKEVFKYPFFPL